MNALNPKVVMKTKETLDPKNFPIERTIVAPKPKSLRPMRSMVAVRSLKPKTVVATLAAKPEEMSERN
jgi:hypothetical protein